MTSRLKSGHPRLDLVLGGGLSNGALTLITGAPGRARPCWRSSSSSPTPPPRRPALYVSTVSEPMDKILRYGRTPVLLRRLAGREGGLLRGPRGPPGRTGPTGLRRPPAGSHRRARARRMIVIDSFKALHAFAREPSDFRWFLHDFAARLSASGASSFWVGEYAPDDIAKEPEFAVADAIVQLSTVMLSERETRVLQILKLRGSGFLSGQHAYRLSERGLDVFPRLADIGNPDRLRAVRRAHLLRHPGPRHHAGRRLLAGRLHAGGGPVGVGEDGDGAELHLRRGGQGRAGPDRQPPGEPEPAPAHRPRLRLVARAPRRRRSCTGRPSTSTSTSGCTPCSTPSSPRA